MPDSQPLSFSADSIVDTVREPMLVLNADLRVRKANRSFYRTFRVTPEETVGRLVYDLGNQQWDIPWLRKLLEEVLPKDSAFDDFEVEHVFPTIGRKYMLLNARRICRKENQTEFILLAIEDTTERRQAEEARRESESRYTSLVKNIKDHSIFMMDLEGNITTWNAEAERIIGYAESEILGRNFSVIFTPEDLQRGLPGKELRLAREDGRAEDERWHVRQGREPLLGVGHRDANARRRWQPHRLLENPAGHDRAQVRRTQVRGTGGGAEAGRPRARTSSWRPWPTNCATRWPRSATACKSCGWPATTARPLSRPGP